MTRRARLASAAWAVGLAGAVACTITVAWSLVLGLYSVHLLFYATFIAAGILGALIGARDPNNGVGWIMSIASLAAVLFFLPVDYGYTALVVESGAWPLGRLALWFGAWAWAPLLGLFLPSLTVRFPDGQVPRRWRSVDWLAIAGTITFAAGIAFAPAQVGARFVQVPDQVDSALGVAAARSPLPVSLDSSAAELIIAAGIAVMLLAYLFAVLSMVDRFRHARGDRRLQLEWFAYAGLLVIGFEIGGGVALIMGWQLGSDIDVAIHLAPFALPLAIAIAILHRHLYDIDVLINRTLVYGALTAILAATYTAGITLLQRLFVTVSGQRSDAVYVLTAFAIVIGFTPVKNWLQGWVDAHVGRQGSAAAMDAFSSEVASIVSVIDAGMVARRLVDQSASAFGAAGAAIYLRSAGPSPAYARGSLDGDGCVEIPLPARGRTLGRLVVGRRPGGATYTVRDREALQRSADSVAQALLVAERLGLTPGGRQSKD